MDTIIDRMRQVIAVAAARFWSVEFFLALVKIISLEGETAACQKASGSLHSTVWCGVNAKP